MAIHHLELPLSGDVVKNLNIGDTVYISGKIFTARDMAHIEIKKLLQEGKALPVDFTGSVVFHAGPVLVKDEKDEWQLSVIGPTTSYRMEPYADMVGQLGVKAIIGKGGMREASREAYAKYGQVYLQAPPGCAVLLGKSVKHVSGGYWFEKGMPEALWILDCEEFGPLVVTMDAKGNSVYNDIKIDAKEKMAEF